MNSHFQQKNQVFGIVTRVDFKKDVAYIYLVRGEDQMWSLPGVEIKSGESPSSSLQEELYRQSDILANGFTLMALFTVGDILVLLYDVEDYPGEPGMQQEDIDDGNFFCESQILGMEKEISPAQFKMIERYFSHRHIDDIDEVVLNLDTELCPAGPEK
ncbi:MAG: hypothetical protein AAB552_04070 [Patescibacteria group bacterium]